MWANINASDTSLKQSWTFSKYFILHTHIHKQTHTHTLFRKQLLSSSCKIHHVCILSEEESSCFRNIVCVCVCVCAIKYLGNAKSPAVF